MSLIGNLEDLSLPDILQIISLSRKSGVLIIHRGAEEGKIFLRQGKVILTTSAASRRNIGEILGQKHLVGTADLERALEEQRRGGMRELLGTVLLNMGLITRDDLEQVVQEQIEETVFYFLTWREGTFKFDLKEVDDRLEVGIDPQVLISQKGIDTQWLVLEGTRLLDERRRKGEEPRAEESAAATGERGAPASLVLVDDDDIFCAGFLAAASARNLEVTRLGGVAQAREFLSQAMEDEGLFLVVDVVMPTSDGRGFLGGLEVARLATEGHPRARLTVISAYPDDSVTEALRALNIPPPILKPEVGRDGSEPDVAPLLESVLAALRPAAVAAGPPSPVEGAPAPVAEAPSAEAPRPAQPAVPAPGPAAEEIPPAPGEVPAVEVPRPAQPAVPAPGSGEVPAVEVPRPAQPAVPAPGPGEVPAVEVPRPARPAVPAPGPVAEEIPPVPPREDRLAEARQDMEKELRGLPAFRITAEDLVKGLDNVQTPSEVGLAILRMASELCERAILFKAGPAAAVSLGGFGFESQLIRLRDGLRNLSIGLEDSPVLARACREGCPVSSDDGRIGEKDLLGMVLGEPLPRSWVVIPARGAGDTVLLLYGDSGAVGRPLAGRGVMKAFLALAGHHLARLQREPATGVPTNREVAR